MRIRAAFLHAGHPVLLVCFDIHIIAPYALRPNQFLVAVVYGLPSPGERNPPDAAVYAADRAVLVLDIHEPPLLPTRELVRLHLSSSPTWARAACPARARR